LRKYSQIYFFPWCATGTLVALAVLELEACHGQRPLLSSVLKSLNSHKQPVGTVRLPGAESSCRDAKGAGHGVHFLSLGRVIPDARKGPAQELVAHAG
jgi:hypothetical protein